MSKITCRFCKQVWNNQDEFNNRKDCREVFCPNKLKKPKHIKAPTERKVRVVERTCNFNISYDKTKASYYDDVPKPIYKKITYA